MVSHNFSRAMWASTRILQSQGASARSFYLATKSRIGRICFGMHKLLIAFRNVIRGARNSGSKCLSPLRKARFRHWTVRNRCCLCKTLRASAPQRDLNPPDQRAAHRKIHSCRFHCYCLDLAVLQPVSRSVEVFGESRKPADRSYVRLIPSN